MHLTLRASGSSGWLPASILAIATAAVLVHYDTPIVDVALFAAYVVLGLALPGMLWVRLLRGRSAHISEDAALGLALGYCLEIAAYIPARAVGAPLLVLVWPIATLVAFAAIPSLRRHWRGSGERAPAWWSWSLAAMLGYLLVYAAGTYFAQHHLIGTDTPYVDMPYHLALIAELRYHVPPDIPYVAGVPLAYHWFFYADAAATSWVTGIEPVTLLYRLSGLPMFVTFVVLTAAAARRLTGGWWTGPVAVAIALFGKVATPYRWLDVPIVDAQTLAVTWISPTNLLGLALFAALVLTFLDLFQHDRPFPRRLWILVILLAFGVAGAKANLLPVLIVGLLAVTAGVGIDRHRLQREAVAGLIIATVGLGAATILLFRGTTGSLVIGLDSLRTFPIAAVTGAQTASGAAALAVPLTALMVAIILWSLLSAGAFGLLRGARWRVDPQVLLLLGICLGALGATTLLAYPGNSQNYYLKGAAGAFGLIAAAGIASLLPAVFRRRTLVAQTIVAASLGTCIVVTIGLMGREHVPRLGTMRLSGVLIAMVVPALALALISITAVVLARAAERRVVALRGAVPILIVALVMGFTAPQVVSVLDAPLTAGPLLQDAVPGDGIVAARWLRDHSDPADLVATDLHCRPVPSPSGVCDARNFWVAGYAERHVLVEGWAYTTTAQATAARLHVKANSATPFWDPVLLRANDQAFTNPSPATLGELRDTYGVQWLFADLTKADGAGLARNTDLRYQLGDFAVYQLGDFAVYQLR